MTYISLYRKYRPKTFSEVVGQNVVVDILKNSIKTQNISHAYIFSGPRGTGKTSIAKIFSKAVNCLNNVDGDLCKKCDVCNRDFNEEIDIIEIDAASNNGVDEIREIRNNVKTMPSHLKYKVYIIDEVHMLSTSAFNALLKTLEEPPKYVIFILATTEFNKIPSTVVSRCQKYDFKKISDTNLNNRLKYILNEEKKELDDDVINLICKLSDGGLRDAINLMDQALSYNKEKVTVDDIYDMIGEISEKEIFDLFDLIINSDLKELLSKIEKYHEEGRNFVNISNRLENIVKDILIYNNTDGYFTEKYIEILQRYTRIELDKLIELSNQLFELSSQLQKNSNQKLVFEIYFIKIALIFSKKDEINNNESLVIKNNKELIRETKTENQNDDEIIKLRINNALSEANIQSKKELLSNYSKIKEYISSKEYNSISNLLLKAIPEVVSERNIIFSFEKNFEVVLFNKNTEEIQKFLKMLYNKKYVVIAVTSTECEKIKEKYKQDIKNGITYQYIEEKNNKKTSKKTSELQSSLENIFGSDYTTI